MKEGNQHDHLQAELPDVVGCAGHRCRPWCPIWQFVYNPDRLKQPMKRVGKRGEGKFVPISWDEAFTTSAQTLQVRALYARFGLEFPGSDRCPDDRL